jgi:hypothetical protein
MRNGDDNRNDFGLFIVAWIGAMVVVVVIMWLLVSMANRF